MHIAQNNSSYLNALKESRHIIDGKVKTTILVQIDQDGHNTGVSGCAKTHHCLLTEKREKSHICRYLVRPDTGRNPSPFPQKILHTLCEELQVMKGAFPARGLKGGLGKF